MCWERVEAQTDRTPVVISREATNGSVSGDSVKRINSARTENRITKPPTCVRTVKLSMMELLMEVMKGWLGTEGCEASVARTSL